jgi:hypothetical protein
MYFEECLEVHAPALSRIDTETEAAEANERSRNVALPFI